MGDRASFCGPEGIEVKYLSSSGAKIRLDGRWLWETVAGILALAWVLDPSE